MIVPVFFWSCCFLFVGVLLADLAYRRYASKKIQGIIENVPTFASIPTPSIPDYEVVPIQTRDDLILEACIHHPNGPPRGVVVFCPELNGNHWTVLHYGRALIESGFVVLSFDFRNQGSSQHSRDYQPIHWVTEYELLDIEAILAFIRDAPELKDLPLGIYGVSRGGSAALLAACRFPEIRSVVTDSGYGTMSLIRNFMYKFSRFVVPDWFFDRLPGWHIEWVLRQTLARSEKARGCRYLRLESEASALPPDTATLLISGGRDSYVTPNVSREVAQTLGRPDSVCIIDKAKHNKSRNLAPGEYDERIVAHFNTSLGATEPVHNVELPLESTTEVIWQAS